MHVSWLLLVKFLRKGEGSGEGRSWRVPVPGEGWRILKISSKCEHVSKVWEHLSRFGSLFCSPRRGQTRADAARRAQARADAHRRAQTLFDTFLGARCATLGVACCRLFPLASPGGRRARRPAGVCSRFGPAYLSGCSYKMLGHASTSFSLHALPVPC